MMKANKINYKLVVVLILTGLLSLLGNIVSPKMAAMAQGIPPSFTPKLNFGDKVHLIQPLTDPLVVTRPQTMASNPLNTERVNNLTHTINNKYQFGLNTNHQPQVRGDNQAKDNNFHRQASWIYYGTITKNGSPVPNTEVVLQFFNGTAWLSYTITSTNSSGYYQFNDLPVVGSGKTFYVSWHQTGTDSSLVSWLCNLVTSPPTTDIECSTLFI